MNKLITQNKEEIRLRNLPEEDFSATLLRFGQYIDALLSLDGEKSIRRLEILLPMIKDCAMSYTEKEMREAFLMYVKGQLDIEPIDNYMTVIQFNKVLNSYKKYKKPIPKETIIEERILLPSESDDEVIKRELQRCAEQIRETGKMEGMFYTHIYDHLDEQGLMPTDVQTKRDIWKEAFINVANNSGERSPNRLRRLIDTFKANGNPATITEAKRISLEKYVKKNII